MSYMIYFDESNKLDQPRGTYSYYGALGINPSMQKDLINNVQHIYQNLGSRSELHFVDYTSDTHFEKYFKTLNYVLNQDVKINLIMINKKSAKSIAKKMSVSLLDLRELFYVKIPERLFYGLTRDLEVGKQVKIIIDENSEYEKIGLELKLTEQMNAHSAYRNKGYKVSKVLQACSKKNIPLQLIDVFMGMIVFLLEERYTSSESISQQVKSDLIYRLLINSNNLEKFHNKVNLFKWEGNEDEIKKINLSEHTGSFLVHKTQYDIKEMNKLLRFKIKYPEKDTKFYRTKMNYSNRQLKMIQGYLAEIKGENRNLIL